MNRQHLRALQVRAQAGDPRAQAQLAGIVRIAQSAHAARDAAARKADYEEDEIERYERIRRELGPGADELSHKAALRAHQWAGLDDVAKFTRINPPTALQGILGNSAKCQLGDLITVANWSGDPSEALPVTVTLGPVAQILSTLQAPVFPFARLTWGNKGMSVTADVDIGRGCEFTVGAASAVLQVGVQAVAGVASSAASAVLSGMLSFYPCVRGVPLTRTLLLSANQNQTVQFPVPTFAQNVQVMGIAGGIATYAIAFLDAQGNTLYSQNVAAGAASPVLPLAGNVAFVNVTVGGGSVVNIPVIFQLGL